MKAISKGLACSHVTLRRSQKVWLLVLLLILRRLFMNEQCLIQLRIPFQEFFVDIEIRRQRLHNLEPVKSRKSFNFF